MTEKLAEKKCVPCEGGVPPLSAQESDTYLQQISSWDIVDEVPRKLRKSYEFDDFSSAMEFANAIAYIADQEGHHPNLHVSYGRVEVILWTHAAHGLTENDFILAAKIDALER